MKSQRPAKCLATILAIILLNGCQSKEKASQNQSIKADSITVANKVTPKSDTTVIIKTEEKFDALKDCFRGKAQPILKKTRFPDSIFKINEDGLSGTETADLKNGDKLIIINGGCEYYVLTFRFETSRFQGDTTDIKFWATKIIDLMAEINEGIDAPIDLKKGTSTLGEYIKKNEILILEDVTFEPGEIRTYLTIDRIQKIDDKRYGLEISFIVGPL